MILIEPRIMAGCRDWWDRHVGPKLLFTQDVDQAVTNGEKVVWWLPDGRLLTERPQFNPSLSQSDAIFREICDRGWSRKGARWNRHQRYDGLPVRSDIEAYFAMPERAVILEYGDNS